MLMLAKGFAYQAFDMITAHRVADDARRNGKTESRLAAAIVACEDGEEIIGETACVAIDAIEFGFLPKALCRFERPRVGLQVGRRRGTGDASELASYTVRRLRPFARRRAMICRPARVAIRARNPCVR